MLVLAYSVAVLLAGVYVLTPLFKASEGYLEAELWMETDLDRLLNRKTLIYGNLKDLEFEHKMGRLSETDFAELEAGYKNEAAAILRQLDRLGAESDLGEAIGNGVSARTIPTSASSRVQTAAVRRCPSCGAEAIAGKKFCADCGHSF